MARKRKIDPAKPGKKQKKVDELTAHRILGAHLKIQAIESRLSAIQMEAALGNQEREKLLQLRNALLKSQGVGDDQSVVLEDGPNFGVVIDTRTGKAVEVDDTSLPHPGDLPG